MGLMKNSTGCKQLDRVESDSRVQRVYRDSDGIWLDLHYGWTADPLGAHDIHENTVRDVLTHLRCVVPCRCEQCAPRIKEAS
jgi:hypothetical protein